MSFLKKANKKTNLSCVYWNTSFGMYHAENDLDSSSILQLYVFVWSVSLQKLFLLSIIRPAWKRLSSRWLGITLTAQCQLVALLSQKNPRQALVPEYIQEGQTKIKLEQFQSAIEPQLKMRWAQRAKLPRVSSEGQRAFKCDRKKNKAFLFFAQLVWKGFLYSISSGSEHGSFFWC